MPDPKPDYPNMYTHTGGKPMDITPKGVDHSGKGGISSISTAGGTSSHQAPADAAITGKGLY